MELLQIPNIARPPVTVDWSRPVIDFDALEWPFQNCIIPLSPTVWYIDTDGRLNDTPTAPSIPFGLTQYDGDSVLGHLTDGRMFVSSREGIAAFEADQR